MSSFNASSRFNGLATTALLPIHLLVTCVLLLLELSPLTLSINIEGACNSHCEENRPNSVKGSFKFNCNETYTTEDGIRGCLESCESCPKEVCDETLDARYWHCPATDFDSMWGQCRDFCSKHRPTGNREGYTLNCDEAYSTPRERRDCMNQCEHCPPYVCKKSTEPKMFHCPSENFAGECKLECDKARRYGSGNINFDWLNPFEFLCNTDNYDPWSTPGYRPDAKVCQDRCRDHCPHWVCDKSKDANYYHCPSAEVDEPCQKFCDSKRKGQGPFYLYCDTESVSQDECDRNCPSCTGPPPPNDFIFVCSVTKTTGFYCPKSEPEKEVPTAKHSYKGICQDRCEVNRGGGFEKYELNCAKRYKTIEEEQRCRLDCVACPNDVCDERQNDGIFQCREVKKEIERENQRRKKEEEEFEQRLEELRKERSDWQVGLGITFGVLLVICLLIVGFTMKKYKRMAPVVYVAVQPSALIVTTTTSSQQQQQPQLATEAENSQPSPEQQPTTAAS